MTQVLQRANTSTFELEIDALSTPALTRQNTELSEPSTPPPSTPAAEDDEPIASESKSKDLDPGTGKKLKITAANGWEARWKLEEREMRKRVKRARSSMSLEEEGRPLLRRASTRGKLAQLPSLPLDILFEIFGHLAPMDVLHLARTTKDFRRVLLNRNATSLWKDVYTNPDMKDVPDCPPYLSLPAWTNLLYDTHCHVLPELPHVNVRNIQWMLRVRLCRKCCKSLLICENKFDKEKKLDNIVRRCIPFERNPSDEKKYCLAKHKEYFIEELEKVAGDRNAFVKEREAEVKQQKQHAKLCRKWLQGILDAREDELDNLRAERYTFIHEKLRGMGYEPEFRFMEMFETGAHDYGNVIPPVPEFKQFDDHEEVRQAKAITERAWNNRVKAIMVEYMNGIRELRLANDRRLFVDGRREATALLWSRWLAEEPQLKRYPPGYFLPTVVDVLEHPRTQSFINEPGERLFEKEEFTAFFDNFHDAIEEWRRGKAKVLLELVSDACRRDTGLDELEFGEKPSVDWMEYAMVVFTCTDVKSTAHRTAQICDDPELPWKANGKPVALQGNEHRLLFKVFDECMFFPEYVHHVCCKARSPTWDELEYHHNLYFIIDRLKITEDSWLRRKAWDAKSLTFNAKASVVVKHVLQACGLLLTTTVKELEKEDPRLVCLKCSHGHRCDGERVMVVRTWRESVKHAMQVHWGSNTVRFERISDEDAVLARKREGTEWGNRYISSKPPRRELRCMHCRDRRKEAGPLTMEGLVEHIDNDHYGHLDPSDPDEEGAEGRVYTKEVWDMKPEQPLCVKMVPKRGYPGVKAKS